MQAGEFMIDQFATSVMFWYSMSAWHIGMMHLHVIVGCRQAGSSQEHHTRTESGGTMWVHQIASSSKVAWWRCMVRMFCGAMLLQGYVVMNMASVWPHQHGATGQSHNCRPVLAQAGESVVGWFAMIMMPLLYAADRCHVDMMSNGVVCCSEVWSLDAVLCEAA